MIPNNVHSLPCTIKKFAVTDGIELSIRLPLSQAQYLETLAKLVGQTASLTLIADQQTLPGLENHPDQMSLGDVDPGDAPQGHKPQRVFLQLLGLPTDEAQLTKAKKLLRKLTGLKAADLDMEVADVSPKRPYTLKNAIGGDVFLKVDAITHVADLASYGAKADLVDYREQAQESEPAQPTLAEEILGPEITAA